MGQIKNIKLHIVTDIKAVVVSNTNTRKCRTNIQNEHACRTSIPTKMEPRPTQHQLVKRQNKVRLPDAHKNGLERRQRLRAQPVRKRESHQSQQTWKQRG